MHPLALLAVVIGVAGVGTTAYLIGRRGTTAVPIAPLESLRRLEEYDFYPFVTNEVGHVQFSEKRFNEAVRHLLEERNEVAARELVVIGQQNLVRDTFDSESLQNYVRLYAAYDGDAVVSDNDAYLENYRRIVNHLGRSFPNSGIEILLHNLVNPSRSLVAIENGAVTGRSVGSGATNLVLDLKTRRERGEDKVNYELNIGSRQFKCTTVPIFRNGYGLVGAVCINIDTHFIRDAASDPAKLPALIDNILRTDFELDENILSKDEYQSAVRGKQHYMDEAIRSPGAGIPKRRLAAIFFSDIVAFTALMGVDETATLRILRTNEEIHLEAFARHGGRLLKRLGDGILASFDTASGAVAGAKDVQSAVGELDEFELRIGIHLGEVVEDDDHDVYGDGVNIASRIQTEVGPGQIGISKVVHDNTKNKDGLSASLIGDRTLKNVDQPVTLYLVDR